MIIIPDIHGRSFWKDAVAGRENEKIIFLGDYTDPYSDEGIDPWEGLYSLREVIEFKKQHADNVVLLLGNHDLSYISNYLPKCRHDEENHDEIKTLLMDNLSLFDIAHEERVGDRRVVFSHAGILADWLEENEIIFGKIERGDEVKHLNRMFHEDHIYAALGDVSCYRGGGLATGSCVWADIEEFIDGLTELLPECFQVFGHSRVPEPLITDHFACLDCHTAFILDDNFRFTQMGCGK